MKRILLLIVFVSFLLLGLFLTHGVNAASSVNAGCNAGQVFTLDCIFPIFSKIVNWALILSGSVALIFFILGAIQFLISGGDQKKVESAKKTMTVALVGIAVIFFSFAIINTIAFVTGVSCINVPGFNACSTP